LELQTGYYALPLCGIDMVLGAEWLVQLGTYATNLQEQFMEFKWQGKSYKLYGSGSQDISQKEITNPILPTNKYLPTNPESREISQGETNSLL
jgi:hypothetical protein